MLARGFNGGAWKGSMRSQSVSLGLCQWAGEQRGITGPHGWVDFPYCAGIWLIPVPLAGVPVDTGPEQVRAEVPDWLVGRQQSILFLLSFQRRALFKHKCTHIYTHCNLLLA